MCSSNLASEGKFYGFNVGTIWKTPESITCTQT